MRILSARSILMLAVGALLVGSDAQAQQNIAAAEKEIRETITQFGHAYGSNDLDTYLLLHGGRHDGVVGNKRPQ